MINNSIIGEDIQAVIVELDDVLYPQKDYLLQVYYVFANFLEYTEMTPPANDLTEFLRKAYEHQGQAGLFEKAAETFGIPRAYEANFNRLHVYAKLPLKLLLYPPMLELLRWLHESGRGIFILTKGNPLMQLNKIRQTEWHGLEEVLKVYFYDELLQKGLQPVHFLLKDNRLKAGEVLYISNENTDQQLAKDTGMTHIHGCRFLAVAE